MKNTLRMMAACLAALVTLAMIPAVAQAQSLPAGQVRIVVGFAPGGAADMVARTYAEYLRAEGLEQVVVDNRPGASSRLAVDFVRKAPADGLTLLLGQGPIFTIYPSLYKKLGFEPLKELRPVASLVDIPTAVVAASDRPYNNLQEFVAWGKQNPKSASIGLAALGTSGHLGSVALGKDVGLDIAPVLYKGSAPMLIDVSSGLVSIGWDAAASMQALYKGGKIKFLAMSGKERLASMPDVPTAKEQGFGQFEHATSFYSIYVPAAASQATVDTLQAVFLKASRNAGLIKQLQGAGLVMAPMPAADLKQRLDIERKFWTPIVQSANISID